MSPERFLQEEKKGGLWRSLALVIGIGIIIGIALHAINLEIAKGTTA